MSNKFIKDGDKVIHQVISEETIDFNALTAEFTSLKDRLSDVPKLKETPDQETLKFWNQSIISIRKTAINNIKSEVVILYEKLKTIKDAGLLPEKYLNKYDTIENFVNAINKQL